MINITPRGGGGSAYGIINGIGNLCAAFIPLLMGMVMRSVGVGQFWLFRAGGVADYHPAGMLLAHASRSSNQRVRLIRLFRSPGYRAFPASGRRGQRGDPGLVIGRRHFHHVHPDNVQIFRPRTSLMARSEVSSADRTGCPGQTPDPDSRCRRSGTPAYRRRSASPVR